MVNLNMWSDPWIPRDLSRRPITLRGTVLLRDVSELMDPATGGWDATLVRDIFWEEDAKVILSIPIHAGRENRMAWHFDKKGIFSVKSAYKVFGKEQITKSRKDGASSSTPDEGLELVWGKIWDVQCAGKIKHFLWRFCHNSHPLRMNLRRRGMSIDTRCVMCSRFDEDGAHLFFKCKNHERSVEQAGARS